MHRAFVPQARHANPAQTNGAGKVVVILPYRDRPAQLTKLLPELLKRNVSHVIVAEQGTTSSFNRGGVKNAGFDAAVRDLRLRSSDTVCFHDVDVCPEQHFGDYPVVRPGEIWHLYGHGHCLGGVFCITVGDFQRIGKFAQWGQWGKEDSDLMQQAQSFNLQINNTRFFQRFQQNNKGFYEMNDKGERESMDVLRQQLQAKVAAAKGQVVILSRESAFRTCMTAVSTHRAVRRYIFF